MSVYTQVDHERLTDLLRRYGFTLDHAEAAPLGIENSTFLLQAHDDRGVEKPLVLTIFEQFDEEALLPYLGLLNELAAADLPVPAALTDLREQQLQQIEGKPTVLMPRLPGQHCFSPDVCHCRQIGALLAWLHRQPPELADDLISERERLDDFCTYLGRLTGDDYHHASQVLDEWNDVPPGDTLIHSDLFRDNALFDDNDKLTGVLDFYNACLDCPEYDLAVALNDWAVAADGRPVPKREASLLAGYRDAGGQWNESLLPLALATAALRFWLSRLAGPVSEHAAGLGSKDPAEFARIFGYRYSALGDTLAKH